jgi:hypothetical protein
VAAKIAAKHKGEYAGVGRTISTAAAGANPAEAAENAAVKTWVGHLATTKDHWADLVTSFDIVKFVIVPALLDIKEQKKLGADAHAILILDLWWGWIDPDFRDWIKAEYPWLHLLYIPGSCTPWIQPCDRGFIALIKAYMRFLSSKLVCGMVTYEAHGD